MAAAFTFTATLCAHEGCYELAVSRCKCCGAETPFCEQHGAPAGDLTRDGIDVAYPARCWKCGGADVR